MNYGFRYGLVVLSLGIAGACSKLPPRPLLTPHQIADDRKPIQKPKEHGHNKFGELMDVNTFSHIERLVDARTYGRKAATILWNGESREASNLNLYDEVADSTWFTNRNARQALSLEEISRGPTRVRLAAEGPLTVVSGKSAGVTPGFVVKDAAGQRFLLKFDPPIGCGLSTGAEAISTRFLYAAGYNVPENNIEYVDPSRLVLDPKAKTKNKLNESIPLDADRFQKLLASLPDCKKDGKIRALASRFIEGAPVGPFSYRGKRGDDPNDRVSHENRRELRGLSILASWLQHTDLTDYNSFDAFVKTEEDRGHLVHYLIDFGGTLGAEAQGPKNNGAGAEYDVDYGSMGRNLFALGFREPLWKKKTPVRYSSLGNFRMQDFDPARWVPSHPDAAILARTSRDAFWGAKLVASFSDEQIETAVRAGDLPEPGATEELIRILQQRRDILAHYWISRVSPLDLFQVTGDAPPAIQFKDWLRSGPWAPKVAVQYQWDLQGPGVSRQGNSREPHLQLFGSASDWDEIRRTISRSQKPYLHLSITPVEWVESENPFEAPARKPRTLAPTTTALFFFDGQDRLHWVGVERSR